jgi:hypothetical protein
MQVFAAGISSSARRMHRRLAMRWQTAQSAHRAHLRLIHLILACALIGCSRGQRISTGSNSAYNLNSAVPENHEVVGEKIDLKADSLQPFYKVIKEAGWEIKAAAGATEKRMPTYLSETISPKITLAELTLQGDGEVEIETYFFNKDKGLIVFPNLLRIEKIYKYSVGERPFCYEVQAENIQLDKTNKAKTYTGKRSIFHYYDEDNDGRFETFEWGRSNAEPRIPQWVLKK